MDNPSSLIFQREETSVDGLEYVRSINKYLRKALKKIEAIQSASDRLQGSQHDDTMGNPQSDLSKKSTSNNCESNEDTVLCQAETNTELTSDKSNIDIETEQGDVSRSNENISYSPEIEVVESDDNTEEQNENQGNTVVDTFNLMSGLSEAPIRQVKYTQSKFHWPIPHSQPFTIKPISTFYKAFVTNLPESATVSKFKCWLGSKGIKDQEDIFIFTKQSFKTSVISFCKKTSRDRLLQLDGQVFNNVALKIRIYVDQNTPNLDKIRGKNKKSQNAKKKS